MKSAQDAPGRVQIENWCQFTMSGWGNEFERFLKPFKGGVSGSAGGKFTGLEGGAEIA